MIFVTVGSQKFQFDRLLMKIDELIENHIIEDTVFAQTGYSKYKPLHYRCAEFMDAVRYSEMEEEMDLMITHGGTGSIIGAVKKGKQVIAVPRLKKFGEHVDDHQIQILKEFDGMGIIKACYDLEELGKIYKETMREGRIKPYSSNTDRIIESIEEFLDRKS